MPVTALFFIWLIYTLFSRICKLCLQIYQTFTNNPNAPYHFKGIKLRQNLLHLALKTVANPMNIFIFEPALCGWTALLTFELAWMWKWEKKVGKTGECGCSLPKFNDSNKLVDAFLANEVKNAAGKSEDIYMRKMPTSLLLHKGGQAISK